MGSVIAPDWKPLFIGNGVVKCGAGSVDGLCFRDSGDPVISPNYTSSVPLYIAENHPAATGAGRTNFWRGPLGRAWVDWKRRRPALV